MRKHWARLAMVGVAAVLSPGQVQAVDLTGLADEADKNKQMHYYVWLGDVKGVERMLKEGVDPNGRESRLGDFFLEQALYARQPEVARALINAGAGIVAKEDVYYLPFKAAGYLGDVGILKLLVDGGAVDLRRPTKEVQDGALLMVKWNNAEALKYLFDNGYSMESLRQANHWHTPLSYAASFGAEDVVKLLLERGQDINEMAPAGYTAITRAAEAGDDQMVDLLLAKGADVNLSGKDPDSTHEDAYSFYSPLLAAVIYQKHEMVDKLLAAGADPAAKNNAPIKIADMVGNQKLYDRLRAAGAPDPGPYPFRELAGPHEKLLKAESARKPPEWSLSWNVANLLQRGAVDEEAEGKPEKGSFSKPTKVAVVSPASLEDLNSLLTAELTGMENVEVLERAQIKKLVREQQLQELKEANAADYLGMGNILGADVLILLRERELEKGKKSVEARIVNASTGVVADVVNGTPKDKPGKAAKRLAGRIARAAPRLELHPGEAVLVSIPRLTASVGTPLAAKLEQRLPMVLQQALSQHPRFVFLEREEMQQLQMEKDLSDDQRKFIATGWLLDGEIDVPLGDGDTATKLKLSLKGGSGKPVELVIPGDIGQPLELVEKASAELAKAMGSNAVVEWRPEKEAKVFFKESKWYERQGLYDKAQAAAEAAWALGKQDDENAEWLLNLMYQRIRNAKESRKDFKIYKFDGMAEWMAYRTPHIFPPTDANELTAAEQLDFAQRMLDLYEPYLEKASLRVDETQKMDTNTVWYYANVMTAGREALALLESLSATKEHREELEAIRQRLRDMSQKLLARIDADPDTHYAIRNHVLHYYLVNLSYLEPDEAQFQKEVRAAIRKYTDGNHPLQEDAVMNSLIKMGDGIMRTRSGRAKSAWIRLAYELKDSDHPAEKILGLAWYSADSRDAEQEEASLREMVPLITEYYQKQRSQPTRSPHYLDADWFNQPFKRKMHQTGSLQDGWPANAFRESIQCFQRRLTEGVIEDGDPFLEKVLMEWTRLNMQQMAEHGSGPIPITNNFQAKWPFPEDLEEMYVLMEQAKPKILAAHASRPTLQHAIRIHFDSMLSPLAKYKPKDAPATSPGTEGGGDAVASADAASSSSGEALVLTGFRIPEVENWLNKKGPTLEKYRNREISLHVLPERTWRITYDGIFELDRQDDVVRFVPNPPNQRLRSNTVVSDRYIGAFGNRLDKPWDQPEWLYRIVMAYDLKEDKWYSHPTVPEAIVVDQLTVAGDKLIYTFRMNPRVKDKESRAAIYEKDTAHGLMMVDIKTGEEKLLASSKRKPQESPLDRANRGMPKIQPFSDTEFQAGRHLYNVETGEWRKRKGEKPTAGPPDLSGAFTIAGRQWTLGSSGKEGLLRARSYRNAEGKKADNIELEIPFTYSIEVDDRAVKGFPGLTRYLPEIANFGKNRISVTPTVRGVRFHNDHGYFTVPLEKVRGLVEHHYEAWKKANSKS